MVDDILLPYRQQVLNDEPVELFDGLTLYPVKMRDYITFNVCSSILKMNKNATNDPKVISMSYLDYILYLAQKDEEEKEPGRPNLTELFLQELFLLVTNKDGMSFGYGVDEKKKSFIEIDGVGYIKKNLKSSENLYFVKTSPIIKKNI